MGRRLGIGGTVSLVRNGPSGGLQSAGRRGAGGITGLPPHGPGSTGRGRGRRLMLPIQELEDGGGAREGEMEMEIAEGL